MSDNVELYYIDGVPSSESIPSDNASGAPSVPSSGNVNQPYKEQSEYSRRLESVEKYVDDLRENTIRKDSDASLKSLSIKDRIVAFFGKIGGWNIENGKLSTNTIEIDSNNEQIKSVNYQPNVSGFSISSNKVEAQNIVARGIMQGSTMQYDTVSAVGGQLMVSNADVLDADMNAKDNSILITKGTTDFSVNDILVIRDINPTTGTGVLEEWFRVTAVNGNTYTVIRDLAGSFTADENPGWKAGTTVAKQGSSNGTDTYSGGWLRLFGEGTNSPYYSVYQRTGVAYNAFTEVARFGNLNGFLDYSTDLYGMAIGETTKYLKYDPTNGLRISGEVMVSSYLTAGIALTAGQAVCIYSDGKVYSTDARVATMTNGFIGFCITNTDVGDTAPILVTGTYDGLTGLTIGSDYYLSDAGSDVEDQVIDGTGLSYSDSSISNWQSFTTGSGVVDIVGFAMNIRSGGDGSIVATLKTGEGTGGTTLATTTVDTSGGSGFTTAYFDKPVEVSPETKYTIVWSTASGPVEYYYSSDSGYTNGTSNQGGTDDFDLKTYSSGTRGLVGTSAGTVSKKVGLALKTTDLLILNT